MLAQLDAMHVEHHVLLPGCCWPLLCSAAHTTAQTRPPSCRAALPLLLLLAIAVLSVVQLPCASPQLRALLRSLPTADIDTCLSPPLRPAPSPLPRLRLPELKHTTGDADAAEGAADGCGAVGSADDDNADAA